MNGKMFDLTNKTALITGATGGIGKEVATLFYKQGAKVVLSSTKEDKLKELADSLGERAQYIACNLEDKEAVKNLFSQAEALAGQIDILVCNAGVTKDNLVIRMSEEEFEEVIDINLLSAFSLNKAAVKSMMKKRWGRIINISSVVAFRGNAGQANYTASKGGMVSMSKSIALEVAARGITVNCVAPGFIVTPMTDVLKDEIKEKLLHNIPCNKFGEPKDIANAVLFLASDEAAYITGQTVHVNGGMYM